MLNIKVSVIIPVYNTAEYLSDALNSITHQSLCEIEIIVVNDGSTDGSLEILERLASSDSRIQIYSQDNKGQSVARNLGLKYASGEFIYFMDSDDILEKEALLKCYQKCKNDDLDLVFFDAEIFGALLAKNGLPRDYTRAHLIGDAVYSGCEVLQKLLEIRGYSASPCLYLIKYAYLKRIKLSFYPGIIHEDELFTFKLFLCASRIGLINRPYFKRRIRNNSTMTTDFSRQNIHGYYTVVQELVKLKNSKENNCSYQLIDNRLDMIVGGVFYNSRRLGIIDRFRVILKFLPRFRRHVSYRSIVLMLFPVHHLLLNDK